MAFDDLLRPDANVPHHEADHQDADHHDHDHDHDPDLHRLLPSRRRKRHQVRIQGRLVLVRSVSAVHLPPPPPTTLPSLPPMPPLPPSASPPQLPSAPRPSTSRHDPAVGSVVERQRPRGSPQPATRRRSLDDGAASNSDEEDTVETARRDRQRRGYGIGGAGNIRRPTEVTFVKRTGPQRVNTHERPDERETERRPWTWMRGLLGRRTARGDP